MSTLAIDLALMGQALLLAQEAFDAGEVPVGAVIARGDQIIARERNRMVALADATAHAELLCIRAAMGALGQDRLTGCRLYVTLEPCAMCAGAIVHARLDGVWYGAADARGGCAGSVYRITDDTQLGHAVPALGGLLAAECGELMSRFFRERRGM